MDSVWVCCLCFIVVGVEFVVGGESWFVAGVVLWVVRFVAVVFIVKRVFMVADFVVVGLVFMAMAVVYC